MSQALKDRFEAGEWVKCIYMGIPFEGKIDGDGLEIRGFWTRLLWWVPFTGDVVIYEGYYFKGLLQWWSLMGEEKE